MSIDERSSRQGYPSDLTDAEWDLIAELLPTPIWVRNLQEPKSPRKTAYWMTSTTVSAAWCA
ncbi:hypothetical protein [Polyangium sorediatum]|uniref:hypothetical protein n=1 Tax=Polyangium sorediatum TaxID=889274 RepID=UPI0010BDD523|nr:hypothetical protein [Polyangium sorediatum]